MFPQSTFLMLAILPETLAPWMSNSTVEPRARPKRRAASSSTDTRGRADDPPPSHHSPRALAIPLGVSSTHLRPAAPSPPGAATAAPVGPAPPPPTPRFKGGPAPPTALRGPGGRPATIRPARARALPRPAPEAR